MLGSDSVKRSKFAWIRTLLAAALSIGWLVPAAIGVDRVLSFLNEDMARLSVMRSARPTYALPTEFNDAPNLLQAREYLIGAAVWLALVIAAWAIYIVRSRRALQTSLSVPAGDLLTAHRHALDHQFKEFAQEIDRHRRDLTSELGPLGQQVSGAQSLLQVRFDAVQDHLNGVDSAMAHQTETLRAVATRLEGGLSAASSEVQVQSEALRESLQTLRADLTERIQAERAANDVQQRSDQDQRFVSIHNAVQVLAAQVETRLDAVQALQAEAAQAQAARLGSALAQQIDSSVDGLMLSVADAHAQQRLDAEALAQQVSERVVGQLIEQVGPVLAAPVAQPGEPLRVEAHIPEALIDRIDAALQARLAAQAEWQARGDETLQALQAAVQALHDQLGETLQLQRDAGSEARRQAQTAVQARQAVQEAQAQAVSDLAVRVDQLRELARSLHVERIAIDGAKWQEALAQIQSALVQAEAAAVARDAKRDSEWAAARAAAPAWAEELTRQVGSSLPQQLAEQVRAQLGELGQSLAQWQSHALALSQSQAQSQAQAQLQAQAEAQRRAADLHVAVQALQTQGEGLRAAVVDAVAAASAQAAAGVGEVTGEVKAAVEVAVMGAVEGTVQGAVERALDRRLDGHFDERLDAVVSRAASQAAEQAASDVAALLSTGATAAAEATQAAVHQAAADAAQSVVDGLARTVEQTVAPLLEQAGERSWAQWSQHSAGHQQALAALQMRASALDEALAGWAQRLEQSWRDLDDRRRSDWQAHAEALQGRLAALDAQLAAAQAGPQAREAAERGAQLQAQVQALATQVQQQHATAQQALRQQQATWQEDWKALVAQVQQELAAARVLAEQAAQQVELQADRRSASLAEQITSEVTGRIDGRLAEHAAGRPAAVQALVAQQAEVAGRIETLQTALAQLGERVDGQREAWAREQVLQQTQQTERVQALAAQLERRLRGAQDDHAQAQGLRLDALQEASQRLQTQQQALVEATQQVQAQTEALAQAQAQANLAHQAGLSERDSQRDEAMLLALERRLSAIDALESQVGRLEDQLGRAGVDRLASRLTQIEVLLSAQGPARLELRLSQLEELLANNARQLEGRLGDLQGLVTQQGAYLETMPAALQTPAERQLDERRLQQLCLNLSDLQENLRLERRQLRKKAESLNVNLN